MFTNLYLQKGLTKEAIAALETVAELAFAPPAFLQPLPEGLIADET